MRTDTAVRGGAATKVAMFTGTSELVFVEDLAVLRAQFIQTYAAMPNKMRNEIIALVDDNPYNWDSAYIEVKGETEVGNRIIMHLRDLKIL